MVIHKQALTLEKLSLIVFGILFIFLFLAACFLTNTKVKATGNDITDEVNITVPVSCTLSGGDHSYNVTLNPGQEDSNIGPSNIKAVCNDYNGYSIYAIGYSGNSYTGNNTKLLGTIANNNISTNTSGNDSYWAMKVNAVSGTYTPTITNDFDNSSFHIIPANYTQVAKYTSSTDTGTSATGSNISAYYKVKISTTQTADTYTGKVKYTLVHPNTAPTPAEPLVDNDCPANAICYAPNANNIEGSMSSISETKISKSPTAGVQIQTRNNSGTLVNITSNSEATLIAPDYSRPGYGFAGWSPEFDAAIVTNPVVYGPNQNITFSTSGDGDADISEHGLILYPVWIASTGNLQNWQECSSLTRATYNTTNNKMIATLSSVTALTDQRDGDVYAVARLADGNCWMMENLRLDANSTTGTNRSLAQGYGGIFVGLDASENSNFGDNDTNATPTNMYNTTNIMGDYQSSRIPRYNNVNTDRTLTAGYRESGYLTYYRWYGYGNYYNWPAAIANTSFYNSSASESAGTSLCPAGWKLPYGRYTGSNVEVGGFFYLNTLMSNNTSAQGSKDWRMFPNNYVYSGMFSSDYEGNRNYSGIYWSSTADQNTTSATFYLAAGSISPGIGTYGKNIGLSVRCIVDF